ncbi:MAG: hypothetical protein ALECFALPRED_009078 [Alectoria fallacina]|uniref:Glucose-methanol-choline oxidoreductase N-terminal domain-containing protein n=1 Tax=Alectoria fallacina TaxID=1903189 RepID=A0A8H3J5Y8_9LECA|nr:MAG: hypothetical protein ALECFALPRED_009078 [Alectoria fallacina]
MGSTDDNLSLTSFLSQKYTHLVIGGGTAGLVVAARLSENPNITVGVLEAGFAAFDDPMINVPGRFGETLGSDYDWQFETIPQPGLNGRSVQWPRGRVLGGSSALNFMTWNRGCREDYDAWEELGAEGWGWNGLLPYFKKSETFHQPDSEHQSKHKSIFDPEQHGTAGPLQTTYSVTYGASHQHWHTTLHKLGIETNSSHFSGSNVGVWTSLTGVTPGTRERSYSATAYYRPNSGRANLHLLTGAFVQEVVLEKEGQDWVAKGVRFTHDGEERIVKTEGEVVICAGSVQSPQLLELSGIGNPDVLKAAGIEFKVDNPAVGENLQDHIMTTMIFEISPSIVTPEDLRADPKLAEAADKEYALSHSGPRTAIPSSIAYLPFSHFVPHEELSSLGKSLLSQLTPKSKPSDRILVDRLLADKNLGQIEWNFDVSNYSPYFKSLPGKKYATMLQMLQYPLSKGSIHTPPTHQKSGSKATAADKPVIDPKYFAGKGGENDFKMVLASQAYANKICSTSPLSDIIVERVYPPSDPTDPNYDFADWVRNSTITDWHPIGTCAMGGKGKEDGYVLDSRLRVYGTKGLRVCDASIMPLHISAHPQATVYAIGEKGAAIIAEDWRGR